MELENDLILSVYLNQRAVFDLMAMLQGGIATVTNITETESQTSNKTEEVKAGFGLSNAFSSLLKIDLSGSKKTGDTAVENRQYGEERVHTPSSLFFSLRRILIERELLKKDSEGYTPKPGDIFEFEAELQRNPVIEIMDSVAEMMKLADAFQEPPKNQKGKNKSQPSENIAILKQVQKLSDSLKAGGTIDLTTTQIQSKYNTVVTIEERYLNDPLMADLVDGKFRVLGKIVKSSENGEAPISLLRKTALSKMPKNLMDEAFGELKNVISQEGFEFPKLSWDVEAPVIQVIPIAIFA